METQNSSSRGPRGLRRCIDSIVFSEESNNILPHTLSTALPPVHNNFPDDPLSLLDLFFRFFRPFVPCLSPYSSTPSPSLALRQRTLDGFR
jgi:hypothetical protein